MEELTRIFQEEIKLLEKKWDNISLWQVKWKIIELNNLILLSKEKTSKFFKTRKEKITKVIKKEWFYSWNSGKPVFVKNSELSEMEIEKFTEIWFDKLK